MKLNTSFSGVLLFLLTTFINVSAQETITVEELSEIYKKDVVSVIFASSEEDFRLHIPNTVLMPLHILSNKKPIRNQVKKPKEIAKIFGKHGISADKTLIVYDEGSGKSAARLYWILKYMGTPDVKVLEGNRKVWKAGDTQIIVTTSRQRKVQFNASSDASQLATMKEVKNAIGNSSYIIVDARTPEEFAGTNETELRRGHIPSAVNLNYETIRNENGMLKPASELKKMFELNGITPDKTIITYCASGVRASTVYLALKHLGYPNAKIYDGSFLEWEQEMENPVVKE